jgi:hypothetical protein
MVPSDPGADGALVFTHDQYQHRVALSSGTSDDVAAVGWEAGDDATFESIVDRLKQAGVRLRNGSRDETQARSVERLVGFEDPDRWPVVARPSRKSDAVVWASPVSVSIMSRRRLRGGSRPSSVRVE